MSVAEVTGLNNLNQPFVLVKAKESAAGMYVSDVDRIWRKYYAGLRQSYCYFIPGERSSDYIGQYRHNSVLSLPRIAKIPKQVFDRMALATKVVQPKYIADDQGQKQSDEREFAHGWSNAA